MHRNEWQLVFFTTLSQMAVGLFVVWGVVSILIPRLSKPHFYETYILELTLATLFLGLVFAALHLGRPLRSFFAIMNLKKSWLSREALAGGIFGLLVVFLLLRQNLEQEFGWVDKISIILGIVAGMLLVYMISRLYMLRTVPVWNNFGTPAAFFVTAFLLGPVAFVGIQILNNVKQLSLGIDPFLGRIIALAASVIIVLLCFQLIVSIVTYNYLSAKGGDAALSVQSIWKDFRGILIFRWGIAIIGLFLLLLIRSAWLSSLWYLIPLALVLISEILGRWLFYLSYKRVGI